MAKKKKKKNKEGKEKAKAQKKAKQEEKQQRKTKRQQKVNDDGEDIDAILADFAKELKMETSVEVKACQAASERTNGTFVAHPSKDELIMFGGEKYDGKMQYVYKDLFLYNIAKREWRCVESKNTPLPRSAHQAVTFHRGQAGEMWIFGGEFSSPSGSQFRHYNDLWCLDLKTYAWKEHKVKGGPQSRSGHRMIAYKRKIIVVGGFHNDKFFDDLHSFDLDTMTWTKHASKLSPSPRSGFSFFTDGGDEAYLYGGYCVVPSKTKKGKEKGMVLKDLWSLNLANMTWNNVKVRGAKPTPRSGMSCAVLSKRAILFGGVQDEDLADDLKSIHLNDCYSFNFEHVRFGKVVLTSESLDKAKKIKEYDTRTVAEKFEDRRKERQFAAPSGDDYFNVGMFAREDEDEEEEDEEKGKMPKQLSAKEAEAALRNYSKQFNVPIPRRSALSVTKGNCIFLFGGIVEASKKEITLGDFHYLDINKQSQGWQTLVDFDGDKQEWLGEISDDEEIDEGDEGDEGDEDEDEHDSDPLIVRTDEDMRAYYARNQTYYMDLARQAANEGTGEKKLRKQAFGLASTSYKKQQI